MNVISYILIAAATLLLPATVVNGALPDAKIETLSGTTYTGQVEQIDDEFVQVKAAGKTQKIPTKDILSLTPTKEAKEVKTTSYIITLLDGTRFNGTEVTTAKREITLQSPSVGKVTLPLELVHHIQLKSSQGEISAAWDKLATSKSNQDRLITQKGNLLDHLSGVVGDISEKKIQFLLDDTEIPVSRKKVFGVIFARKDSKPLKPICELTLHNGEQLKLKSIKLTDKGLESILTSKVKVTIPVNQVKLFDFSLGKVKYLSQMKPRSTKFTSYLGYEYSYRNDKNDVGQSLKLDKTYSRGLWIHSKTELTYRISRQYNTFHALIGIDRNLTNYRQGNVHVVIRGDDKVLFDQIVKGEDKPKVLTLPVKNVLDLEILVDFGQHGDFCDHLDMINAKVLK